MIDRIYRWSPKRAEEYELSRALGPSSKALLSFSPEHWNLAWLSHPFEEGFPDHAMRFDDAITRTLDRAIHAPGVDAPMLSMCKMMKVPATSFALVTAASPDFADLPIVKLLGPQLKQVWLDRARLARSDHPATLNRMLDYHTEDTRAAQLVLQRFRAR